MKKAYLWSAFWIASALVFNALVYFWKGQQAALNFFTGYLIEKSLSVDNLFIFYLIFQRFGLNTSEQRRILNWGIIGAFIMRAIFIFLGIALLNQYHWVLYLMGLFLLFAGVRMVFEKTTKKDWSPPAFLNKVLAGVPKPVAALTLVESADLIFALDSIPAVLAITQDPFIVYTSNIFAILGLRSLYFVLAHTLSHFRFLHYGLAGVLVFVGSKMLLSDLYPISTPVSLAVIVLILLVTFWCGVRRA